MTKELVEETLEITCRNCGEKSEKVWVCKLEIPNITRYVFFCANCQRCLGVSNNKNPQSLIQPANNMNPSLFSN